MTITTFSVPFSYFDQDRYERGVIETLTPLRSLTVPDNDLPYEFEMYLPEGAVRENYCRITTQKRPNRVYYFITNVQGAQNNKQKLLHFRMDTLTTYDAASVGFKPYSVWEQGHVCGYIGADGRKYAVYKAGEVDMDYGRGKIPEVTSLQNTVDSAHANQNSIIIFFTEETTGRQLYAVSSEPVEPSDVETGNFLSYLATATKFLSDTITINIGSVTAVYIVPRVFSGIILANTSSFDLLTVDVGTAFPRSYYVSNNKSALVDGGAIATIHATKETVWRWVGMPGAWLEIPPYCKGTVANYPDGNYDEAIWFRTAISSSGDLSCQMSAFGNTVELSANFKVTFFWRDEGAKTQRDVTAAIGVAAQSVATVGAVALAPATGGASALAAVSGAAGLTTSAMALSDTFKAPPPITGGSGSYPAGFFYGASYMLRSPTYQSQPPFSIEWQQSQAAHIAAHVYGAKGQVTGSDSIASLRENQGTAERLPHYMFCRGDVYPKWGDDPVPERAQAEIRTLFAQGVRFWFEQMPQANQEWVPRYDNATN